MNVTGFQKAILPCMALLHLNVHLSLNCTFELFVALTYANEDCKGCIYSNFCTTKRDTKVTCLVALIHN